MSDLFDSAVASVEAVAQWLHDEGGFGDSFSGRTWPEHPDDTGQREGGWVKIVPSDVQAKFRDVARRLLTQPAAAALSAPQGEMEREAFRPMSEWDQRNETVLLLVDYSDGDHPLDDAKVAITIGHNNDHNVGDGEGQGWQFAGWCWSHDHYVEGKGTPIGWLPLPHHLAVLADLNPAQATPSAVSGDGHVAAPHITRKPEQLAMAKRIAAEQIGWPTYEDAAAHNHHTDEYASVALAAIIETQRLDAELAESVNGSQQVPNWPLDGREIATAIREGKHYGKDQQ